MSTFLSYYREDVLFKCRRGPSCTLDRDRGGDPRGVRTQGLFDPVQKVRDWLIGGSQETEVLSGT